MGELKKWLDQKWVRIGTDGEIKGECGTSKKKEQKQPERKKEKVQKVKQSSKTRKKRR